jgi:hypothetical protein
MEEQAMSDSTTSVLSEHEWHRHFDGWRESGLSQSAYCREQNISFHRFRYWRSKLELPKGSGEIVRVPLQVNAPRRSLELVCGQYTIRVPEGFDEATLKRLLGLVEKSR